MLRSLRASVVVARCVVVHVQGWPTALIGCAVAVGVWKRR